MGGSLDSVRVKVGVAVLVWRDGRVLMGRRKGSHGAGTWSFPGGKVDPGELTADAAIREVSEETGLRIVDPKHLIVGSRPLCNLFYFSEIDTEFITVFMEADCPFDQEPRVMEPDKVDGEWIWVTPGDWPSPLFEPVDELFTNGW